MSDSGTKPTLDHAPDSSRRYNACALASPLCALAALLPVAGGWIVLLFDLYFPTHVAVAVILLAPLGGLAALILSLIAHRQFDKHPTRYRGRLLALVGLTIGGIFTLFSALILGGMLIRA